jgi:hypothetical protein
MPKQPLVNLSATRLICLKQSVTIRQFVEIVFNTRLAHSIFLNPSPRQLDEVPFF